MTFLHKDIAETVLDEKQLEETVSKLAGEINRDYQGKRLVVVGILKGSIVFLADLFRRITVDDCSLEFMSASSYGSSSVSSGNVNIKLDVQSDLSGSHVLIVEDILDTGNTLTRLKEHLMKKNTLSVRICTLFDKPSRRCQPVSPDYCGKTIDDLFIVGYGLDYDERYRNLPYVGVLKQEIYQ